MGLVNWLDLVLRDTLRGALPVYKTMPIPALHCELGIQPMKLVLNHRRAALAAQIKGLDSRHPLVQRCTRAAHTPLYTTRLTRAALQAGPTELYNPLALSPWAHTARREDTQVGFSEDRTKEQAAKEFNNWLQQ